MVILTFSSWVSMKKKVPFGLRVASLGSPKLRNKHEKSPNVIRSNVNIRRITEATSKTVWRISELNVRFNLMSHWRIH